MPFKVDMAGDDLYVNNVYTNNATPGNLSGVVGDIGGTGISLTTGTLTLTPAQNNGLFIFNVASGTTVTLPPPIVGLTYFFSIGTVATSNSQKVITNSASTFLAGGLNVDKALTVTRYAADGSTIRSINLNGTTTGGATVGDTFEVTAISSTVWNVTGITTASGTLATPFATS